MPVRRVVLALLVALLCCVAAVPARADSTSLRDCVAAGGVWVSVDTDAATIAAGCAQHPTSGTDALRKIGIVVQQRADGKGFICELQGLPHNACADNGGFDKATGAYWSYWHRSGPDGAWTASEQGGDSYVPPDGSIDGWRWGAGTAPRDAPAAVPAPAPQADSGFDGPWPTVAVLAVLVLGGLAAWWWSHRRRSRVIRPAAEPVNSSVRDVG